MSEQKTVSIRLHPSMISFIETRGDGINQGIKNCIDKLQTMERYADMSLAGLFTPAEWRFMAESLGGNPQTAQFRYNNTVLTANIKHVKLFRSICASSEVDAERLCDKISGLSPFTTEALYRRLETLWRHPEIDIDEWSKF